MPPQPHSRYDVCAAEFDASLLSAGRTTGGRFNLVRPALYRHGVYSRDIILSTGGEGTQAVSARFLVTDVQAVNLTDYNRLREAGVPQPSLLSTSGNLAVFNIPRGAKPLRYEPLHGHASSATYIGDHEIYTRAGALYATAWRTTGKLPLDGPGSNPAAQLAITNFADERGHFLYLCPPYMNGVAAATHTDARMLFLEGLAGNLPGNARQYHQELMAAAARGFDLGAREAVIS